MMTGCVNGCGVAVGNNPSLAPFARKEYSGDAMYKKIIADAEDQLHRISCFVAGTLVHTKEGLRPIEQIKVGDYVLSKPENGEGEASYKRVSRTFENGEKEVWFVSYAVEGDRQSKFIVATAEHPFWVKRTITPLHDVYEETVWVKTADLYRRFEEGLKVVIELADGTEAYCDFVGPMVALSADAQLYSGWTMRLFNTQRTLNRGLVYSSLGLGEGNSGSVIDFSKGYPEKLLESDGEYVHAFADLETELPYDHLSSDDVSYVTRGHTPLLRRAYNIEVEDNHTYYVGEWGVLVHNTCQKKLDEAFKDLPAVHQINPNVNPKKRGQIYFLTGNSRFAEAVEQITGCRIERRGPGGQLR